MESVFACISANPAHFIIVCAIIIKQRRNSNKSTFRQSDYPSHPVPNKTTDFLASSFHFPMQATNHPSIYLSICLSSFFLLLSLCVLCPAFRWVWILFARLKLSKLFSHKIQMLAFSVVLSTTHSVNGLLNEMAKGYAKQMFSAHIHSHSHLQIIRRIYVRKCPSVIFAQAKLIAWENEIIWWWLFSRCWFVCFRPLNRFSLHNHLHIIHFGIFW